jgi:hypothetical protein
MHSWLRRQVLREHNLVEREAAAFQARLKQLVASVEALSCLAKAGHGSVIDWRVEVLHALNAAWQRGQR